MVIVGPLTDGGGGNATDAELVGTVGSAIAL
jgi:hypothetical protein